MSEEPWRPIADAEKGGAAIWALFRSDISERTGRADLKPWDGIQLPLIHPGTYRDEQGALRDHGWNVAAAVGVGGFPDDWIEGWVPLRSSPNGLSRLQKPWKRE